MSITEGITLPVIGFAAVSRHDIDVFATAWEAWLHACGRAHAHDWDVRIIPILDTSGWIVEEPSWGHLHN